MSESNTQFRYPEELEPIFTQTDGIEFSDGRYVSSKEIWRFMTEEAPRRFPHTFHLYSSGFIGTSSGVRDRFRRIIDVNLLSGIKSSYLSLTLKDRLQAAREKGTPIILAQGGQTVEPYYAAGGIPLRPGFTRGWATNMVEGLNIKEAVSRSRSILEEGKKKLTGPEGCSNVIGSHTAVQDGILPVDFVAPILCLRCSDMAYVVETHRHGKRNVPTYLVDYPVPGQDHHPNKRRIEYLKTELKILTEKIGKLSGKEVTYEDLQAEIKLENKARKLVRECYEIWLAAKVPPTNSADRFNFIGLAVDGSGDFLAAIKVLEEKRNELKERAKHGIKGAGLKDDPVRLYTCGSCVSPNFTLVDNAGGVIVGKDDHWSGVSIDRKEIGDPYENLAEAILSFPYELPTQERAEWTAQEVKRSRAEGVIFLYNWGCNYQTGVARMVSDIIKERTGVPTTYIEVEIGEDWEQIQNRIESFIEIVR